MRCTVDDHVVFDDDLDKGCGNQVFDYGNSIRLRDTDNSDSPCDSSRGTNSDQPQTSNTKTATTNANKKSINDVILPLELLNQPSEYDDDNKGLSVKRDLNQPIAQGKPATSGVVNGSKSSSETPKRRPPPQEVQTGSKQIQKSKSHTQMASSTKPVKAIRKSASSQDVKDVETPTESSENPAGVYVEGGQLTVIYVYEPCASETLILKA